MVDVKLLDADLRLHRSPRREKGTTLRFPHRKFG
jgi:hypothetical protein